MYQTDLIPRHIYLKENYYVSCFRRSLAYVFYNTGKVPRCITATLIISDYIYPCTSPLSSAMVLLSLIFLRPFYSFFVYYFAFDFVVSISYSFIFIVSLYISYFLLTPSSAMDIPEQNFSESHPSRFAAFDKSKQSKPVTLYH